MSMKRFHVRKPVIATVAAASAFVAVGLAIQQPAKAGTNGQHITPCTENTSLGLYQVDIKGYNQNGQYTEVTQQVDAVSSGGCVAADDALWWKGNVNISWHYHAYSSPISTTCDVPEYFTWDSYPCSDGQ